MFNLWKFLNKPLTKTNSYITSTKYALWSERSYYDFAKEAYINNVIAHQSIRMISTAASSVPIKVYRKQARHNSLVVNTAINKLLDSPNPRMSGRELLECLYSYKQISGNAYLLGCTNQQGHLAELYCLRPDHIHIHSEDSILPSKYVYKVKQQNIEYYVNSEGFAHILHLKNFNPLNELYGLSSIEAASYAIDQHNQSGEWNQALLQNGARPSGVIVVNKDSSLTDAQYNSLKEQVDSIFSGPRNAGKPMVLDGGLDWKEMSLSPRDMDFIATKHSSARDIALALGVPPQLLGIPGDNTYANLQEARLAFWEQTIIPLLDNTMLHLGNWLSNFCQQNLSLEADLDKVAALSARRDSVWERINNANFMTINEKRAAMGLPAIKGGDQL